MTGYAVTFGGLLLLGGRAGDILDRRRMFSAGILFLAFASLLGGLATTSSLLITARVLQGLGAALAGPAGLSLIVVTFPEGKLRTRGPRHVRGDDRARRRRRSCRRPPHHLASWRWAFFVNVPIGLLPAFGARLAIPESQHYPGGGSRSAALSAWQSSAALPGPSSTGMSETRSAKSRPGTTSPDTSPPGWAARSTITRCPAASLPRGPWAREQRCSPSSSRPSRSGCAVKTFQTARW